MQIRALGSPPMLESKMVGLLSINTKHVCARKIFFLLAFNPFRVFENFSCKLISSLNSRNKLEDYESVMPHIAY